MRLVGRCVPFTIHHGNNTTSITNRTLALGGGTRVATAADLVPEAATSRFWRPPTISPRTHSPLKSEEPLFLVQQGLDLWGQACFMPGSGDYL